MRWFQTSSISLITGVSNKENIICNIEIGITSEYDYHILIIVPYMLKINTDPRKW